MKSILLLLLFCVPFYTFAQKSIMVLPYTDADESLCDNYGVYNNKQAIKAIEDLYKLRGFEVMDTRSPMKEILAQNQCSLSNDELKGMLLGGWQKSYVEVSYSLHKTSKGNYMDLFLFLKQAETNEVLVALKKTSKKLYLSDINKFTSMLFTSCFDEFQALCYNAYKTKQNISITNLRIPSIAPGQKSKKNFATRSPKPQKEDVKPSKQPKGLKNEEVAVVEKVLPLSDVDIKIPNFGKVNIDAVAVIIGNKSYRNQDVPEVDFAINDAKFMKEYLIKGMGFKEGNIIYLEDATQADFNATFGIKGNHKGKLYNYVKPNVSDVFVFYSGHGAPNPENNKGYFVPVDTDPSLIQFNGYALDTFYENLGLLPYRKLSIVIDACFSGSSDGGMLLQSISPVFIKTENRVLRDPNAIVLTSASSEQVSSWYTEKYHSLFTYFYLKGLQGDADLNADRKVDLKEMRNYIMENVPYMARRLNNREQTPELTGDDQTVLIEF